MATRCYSVCAFGRAIRVWERAGGFEMFRRDGLVARNLHENYQSALIRKRRIVEIGLGANDPFRGRKFETRGMCPECSCGYRALYFAMWPDERLRRLFVFQFT